MVEKHAIAKFIPFLVRYLIALASSVYLFLVGFARGRNRTLLYNIAHHFTGMDPEPNRPKPELPVISLRELLLREYSIQMCELGVADGNVTVLELIVLNQLVVKHGPKRLFEIGTFDGRTTLNLAANAADDARVFTLDLPQEQMTATALNVDAEEKTYINKATSGSRFIGKEYELKITQLYGDSATFDFSPFENSMDFVFVDGSHTYEYVMNDSCVALRLLSNGRGVILWHDFNAWPGVTLALNALHRDWREFRELKHVEGTTLAYLHLG